MNNQSKDDSKVGAAIIATAGVVGGFALVGQGEGGAGVVAILFGLAVWGMATKDG